MTSAVYSTLANTFGHAAYDDESRITDAMSAIIGQAPTGMFSRFRFERAFRTARRAQFQLVRAHKRLAALALALQAREGARLSQEFDQACRGAFLLIGADIVTALLLDRSGSTKSQALSILAMMLPDYADDLGGIHGLELDGIGNPHEVDAINAVTPRSFECDVHRLAKWHAKRGDVLTSEAETGFVADLAYVRDLLFQAYNGHDVDLEHSPSLRPIYAGAWAIVIGRALAMRKLAEDRAPVVG